MATLALLDMLNGTSSWYHPDGARTPQLLAEIYVELAISGLLVAGNPAHADRRPRGGDGRRQAFG